MRRRDFLKLGAVVAVAAACDVSPEPDDETAEDRPDEPTPPEVGGDALVIVGAEVFDGQAHLGRRDVAIREGILEQVGEDLETSGAEIVDADGATLLPGLIDAHTHSYEPGWLRQSLLFGVTTQLDMFTDPTLAGRLRGGTEDADRAYFYSAGYMATTPEGHGTQFGLNVPTLTDPAEAASWVDDRVEEGSDFIKIVVDEWGDGPLAPEIVAALADAARDRGLLSVAHAMTPDTARIAIEGGVDGLAHTVVGSLDDDVLEAAIDRDIFLISTISVLRGFEAPAEVLDDERLGGWLHPPDVRHLEEVIEATEDDPGDAAQEGMQSLAAFHEAGLPVLAGTDARNPGVVHGAAMHTELELLTDSGLEPAAALAAATSIPAAVFGLDDRGRIEQGRRADLLLVDGDPLNDITTTRNIVRIWKRGNEVDRDAAFDRTQP